MLKYVNHANDFWLDVELRDVANDVKALSVKVRSCRRAYLNPADLTILSGRGRQKVSSPRSVIADSSVRITRDDTQSYVALGAVHRIVAVIAIRTIKRFQAFIVRTRINESD